jgi:hypothetical protein
MDAWTTGEIVRAVALAIALAACTGLRAWLPLLLAGILSRMEILTLGESWRFLGSNTALLLFGIATVIEIAGDKIPAVDHTLDAISTVLRPAAGSVLAASVLGFVNDPLAALALGAAVGAPSALVPHALKSGLRAASSTFTLGLANPVVSLFEDGLTLVLFALAILVPLLLVFVLLLLMALVARRVMRRQRALTGAP